MTTLHSMAQRRRAPRMSTLRNAFAAALACALIAGCGGEEDAAADAQTAIAQDGDGSAAAQAPIVAPPGTGGCGDSETGEGRPCTLNSKLDCAP